LGSREERMLRSRGVIEKERINYGGDE